MSFMSYLSNEDPMMFGVASINMDAVFNMMLQNDEMQSLNLVNESTKKWDGRKKK